MAEAWAQLWDEDGNVLLSDLESGVADVTLTSLDTGVPSPRVVSNDAPGRSGALDNTRFFSGRAVSMTFACSTEAGRRGLMSTVSYLYVPSRRPRLAVFMPEWGDQVWSMPLRIDSPQAPLTYQSEVSLVWVNPTGVWESQDEHLQTIFPSGDTTGGLIFPVSFPLSFGTGSPPNGLLVTNEGTVDAPPTIRIYGPISSPVITNLTTGDSFGYLDGRTVPAGEYVSIDCDAGTVLANDDPAASRFGNVDIPNSDFWALRPGVNQLTLTGTGTGSVTQATVSWHDRRI